jgi:hypothetical protein
MQGRVRWAIPELGRFVSALHSGWACSWSACRSPRFSSPSSPVAVPASSRGIAQTFSRLVSTHRVVAGG